LLLPRFEAPEEASSLLIDYVHGVADNVLVYGFNVGRSWNPRNRRTSEDEMQYLYISNHQEDAILVKERLLHKFHAHPKYRNDKDDSREKTSGKAPQYVYLKIWHRGPRGLSFGSGMKSPPR